MRKEDNLLAWSKELMGYFFVRGRHDQGGRYLPAFIRVRSKTLSLEFTINGSNLVKSAPQTVILRIAMKLKVGLL